MYGTFAPRLVAAWKKSREFGRDVIRESLKQHGSEKIWNNFTFAQLGSELLGPNYKQKLYESRGRIYENQGGVQAGDFVDITGQLLVDTVKDMYEQAALIGDKLSTTVQVTNGNLNEHKVPYLGMAATEPTIINEGEVYPQSSFGPYWVTLAACEKFGSVMSVTKEMLFSDLTKQVYDAAKSIATRAAIFREEKILKALLGITNNHKWNDVAYNTYLTSGAWVNKKTNFALNTVADIDGLAQIFVDMVDPSTGKPIVIEPKDMFVARANLLQANLLYGAKEMRAGDITSGQGYQVVGPNPLNALNEQYEVHWSRFSRKLLTDSGLSTSQADSLVILGDFKKAIYWREAWPLQVQEAPANNPAMFHQDIDLQIKVSASGVAGVMDPRFVVYGYTA